MYVTTIKSSATFGNVEVSDIGRRCLLTLVTGVFLIRGAIFANFQVEGNFCSRKELFNIVQTGRHKNFCKLFQ